MLRRHILFVSQERSQTITGNNTRGAPGLVVEALSPATTGGDRGLKRRTYAKYGVKEYSLVKPEGKSIEAMTLEERGFERVQLHEMGQPFHSPFPKGFSLDSKEII